MQHASFPVRVWRRVRALVRALLAALGRGHGRLRAVRRRSGLLYADEVVRIAPDRITVRRYYWPWGRKHIPFDTIRGYRTQGLTMGQGQYRLHGIDRRGRWYSRDRNRPDKALAIVLDTGRRIRPVLTPADPEAVLAILGRRVGVRARSS